MNLNRTARIQDNIFIIATGPINRGLEVTPEVADGSHSVILDPATNSLAMRKRFCDRRPRREELSGA